MKQAILTYLELVRNLAEKAGAAPLAAALKIKERLKGEKIALILSGGNISLERLKTVLSLKTNCNNLPFTLVLLGKSQQSLAQCYFLEIHEGPI